MALVNQVTGTQPIDPAAAYKAYREFAGGDDAAAAHALYRMATLAEYALKEPQKAILASTEYERRFADGKERAEALVRVEAYLSAGDRAGAQSTAELYLQRYPAGDGAARAKEVAAWPRNQPPR